MTPLQLACMKDNDQITSLLVENTDAENLCKLTENNFPLHLLCKNKIEKFTLVNSILNKLKTASKNRKNYLHLALTKLDNNQQPMLHLAVENNHLNIVESLLRDHNVEKDQKDGKYGNNVLHLAAKTGSIKMLELFEKYNVLNNNQNNLLENPLHIAANYNRVQFIKKFLELENADKFQTTNPSVQMLNKNNYTPLINSVTTCNQSCFEEIVRDKNVKFNVKTSNGSSIYHKCAEFNNVIAFKYSLKNFYSSNPQLLISKNVLENTVLHTAALSGSLEIIKLVCEHLKSSSGLEQFLYSKNTDGQTFFHLACFKGHLNIIEYFLRVII